ncbi:single-stranded-DNA-specific exonuclease RecJ [Paracerasibacillus soli]|uniref:Single-stranded-DNA-specific exonuclease RecJ n=1 Tax=Paracerasibacillus soli TaxID=480284 RepID=A0ABU5CQR2_9BACI|nr:single-stranded-DNA-specific exonuclease RecJ [Virgibacillus soli]MDY0408560.1 single-stranded-DNA-specific exonuclease RecJ [Virgibacillus soli]
MLPSKSKWNFLKIHEQDNFNGTDETLNMSPFLINLLMQRDVMTIEEAKKFLNPVIQDLHNPVQLHSIEKASERIVKAIEYGEKILVYGDYDADGVTSTTVMIEALRELGANCDFYIPNRFSEGYGPNEQAFQLAHEQGVSVIITVDNGIAAVQEAAVAKELGIDLIITDHHEVQDAIPDAFSIIHPKCSENYPFKELAGVGVAFKLAQYILGYFPEDLLDLVAIGTIADMVPLLDENRVLAFYGLQRLTTTRRPGLKALIKSCKIEGNVTEEDVGFLIGPRLNAVGRLQDATLAVELLLTDDEMEAEVIAEEIEQLNQERRNIVEKIVKEAEQSVDANDLPGVIVVAKPGWNQGVLGIVASGLLKSLIDQPLY